jgi:hypothetical protein
MAFGQSAGPPASSKELGQLLEALQEAGYASFREARHPLGLTQRQANGKFTRDEARELVDRLTNADVPPTVEAEPVVPGPLVEPDRVTMAFPDELLAAELVRRGWTCTPPPSA